MAEKKTVLKVWCGSCDTECSVEAQGIERTGVGLLFYVLPDYRCVKCQSTCMVELVEVEDGQRLKNSSVAR